jgi:hypothetical protein
MPPSSVVADRWRGQRRCVWCGRESDVLESVELPTMDRWGRPAGVRRFPVDPRHRQALLAFSEFSTRYGPRFIRVLGLWLVATVVASWFRGIAGAGLGLMLLGLVMFALPFATPETVAALGIRGSVLLVRCVAVAIALIGAALLLIG